MNINDELTLSYYKEVSELNTEHEVFLVKDTRSNRLCVKKILYVYDIDVYRYLLDHPVANTPRIYEAIEDDGKLIVIEEYINGTGLDQLIESVRLSEEEAAQIADKLCRIVRDLHNCVPPIVHRDIKPSNIIITDDGTVKLLDMNAAKLFLDEGDRDTELIGTAGFAAPEQYGFSTSSAQTDMYAIGVVMAYMVYGTFSRNSLRYSPYDRIIERCTRLDPEDRYRSINEIIAALGPIRRGDKIEYPAGKFIRWLPPGFRTLRPGRMLIAAALYALVFYVGFTMESRNAASGLDIVINRVFFILSCLTVTFFVGNYMDVWTLFGITRIRNKWLRWLAVGLTAAILFFAVLMILVIIEDMLN